MDIHFDQKPLEQQPQAGWHEFADGRFGFCTKQGENFALQFFKRGQVTDDNFQDLAERSSRLALCCFSEMGWPGPSALPPRPLTPPQRPATPAPPEVDEVTLMRQWLNSGMF